MEYCEDNEIPGILFGADCAAAFDSIDHTFMFSVLKRFGFGDSLIQWVRILHTNIESCVMNNGFSTGYFDVSRGTRQGDPLAPLLFILVMEVLANMVRDNPNIHGIIINNKEIKLTLFADDTTFFLGDVQSLFVLEESLSTFTNYTSMKINYDKSEAAWIGSWKNR